MNPIHVNPRTVAIDYLRPNMEKHRAIFEEAVEGYRAEALRLLEEQIERIKKGRLVPVQIMLPLPVDHTKDYERVIQMMTICQDEEIELTEEDFAAYVMDDWRWKQEFLVSNSRYSQTATSMLQ